MNLLLYRLDDFFDSAYQRSLRYYVLVIAGLAFIAAGLVVAAALINIPGSVWEALLGGSAGVCAYVAARGIVTHYNRANPEDWRPPLRERLGSQRSKLLGLVAGAWIVGLIVVGAQGLQHPAIGALTIMVALSLVTLATRTAEEKAEASMEDDQELLWSSDPEQQINDDASFIESEEWDEADTGESVEEDERDEDFNRSSR